MYIVGMRGGGKTFNWSNFFIDRFKSKGEQFAYVRRTEEDLKSAKPAFFRDIQAHGYHTENEFKNIGNTFFMDGEEIGYCFSVNSQQRFKSSGYPKVMWLLFDEFIPENDSFRVQNEVSKFINLYETIARLRDVRAVFIANALTRTNPYFEYFNFRPQVGSTFTRHKNGEMIIEMYYNAEYADEKRKSRFGQIIEGTKEAEMMIANKFVYDNYNFVVPRYTGNMTYLATIVKDGKKYGMSYTDKGEYYIHNNVDGNKRMIMTFNIDDHDYNIIMYNNAMSSPYMQRLKTAYEMGLVKFQNLSIKQDIYAIFNFV